MCDESERGDARTERKVAGEITSLVKTSCR